MNPHVLTTNGVTVSVLTKYLPDPPFPAGGQFIFGYFIAIQNQSPYTIQLLRRYWHITDSRGIVRIVDEECVVGLQPIIPPGGRFEYGSYCNLDTDMGKMVGSYLMVRQSDNFHFRVEVPEFLMVTPAKLC